MTTYLRLFSVFSAVVLLQFNSGCGEGSSNEGLDSGTPDSGTPDSGAPDGGTGCVPTGHATQGFAPDLAVQRYRILGWSADGEKIAVLYSHFGPSSGDPFATVVGYQAGADTKLFSVTRFGFGSGTSEAALAQVERDTLADSETMTDLDLHGIALSAPNSGGLPLMPTPEPCCSIGDQIVTTPTLTFSSNTTPCQGGTESTWSVCTSAHCVKGSFECGPVLSGLALVDVFQIQGVHWAIVEQKFRFIDPLYLYARTAAGGILLVDTSEN